ncbi:TPA: hypothetical protein ACT3KN_001722 [Klebsiella quasipneumoniae subsp. similipneumoniae]
MTTDITEMAQSKSLRKKLNRRLNDAYGFQRTSGGKHTTISLSIAECKSAIAALEKHLALVEALEKAQGMEAYWKVQCRGITDHCEVLQARIAELESRTVKLPEPFKLAKSLSGLTYYYAEEVDAAITAAGIKVEAE